MAALLAACSSGLDAVVGTVQEAVRPSRGVSAPRLDPRFKYLRATVDGKAAFLALGYEVPNPVGPVDIWYSATGEVVRLQNGRLAGVSGVPTEWRNVGLSNAPSWNQAARAAGELTWLRTRDVMPGYRYGVQDHMTLRRVAAPRRTALQGIDPARLSWFEETMATSSPDMQLPPTVYGVDVRNGQAEVAYAEQCLSKTFCFTWQRWDVAETADARQQKQ